MRTTIIIGLMFSISAPLLAQSESRLGRWTVREEKDENGVVCAMHTGNSNSYLSIFYNGNVKYINIKRKGTWIGSIIGNYDLFKDGYLKINEYKISFISNYSEGWNDSITINDYQNKNNEVGVIFESIGISENAVFYIEDSYYANFDTTGYKEAYRVFYDCAVKLNKSISLKF